jgi:hypothetical protein
MSVQAFLLRRISRIAVVCAAVAMLLPPTELEAQGADASGYANVVDEVVRACNERAIDTYVRAYDPRVLTFSVGDTAAVWLRGAEQVRQWASWTCPRIQIEVLDRFISGNLVFQRERHWQVDDSGNRTTRWTQSRVYLVKHGSIQRQWTHAPESNDPAYVPPVEDPRYPESGGPAVYIDHAHANAHEMDGRYWAFAELLRRDGYVVRPWPHRFDERLPDLPSVLVVATAQTEIDAGEAAHLRRWVEGGGGLLMIADHSPFSERMERPGAAFGIEFSNGFVRDTAWQAEVYRRAAGTVVPHPVTDGFDTRTRVDSIVTYTGSAFSGPQEMQPLLRFPRSMALFAQRSDEVPQRSLEGLIQAGAMRVGRGKVVVFAEAGMFRNLTPQASSDAVAGNDSLARNVIYWLARQ